MKDIEHWYLIMHERLRLVEKVIKLKLEWFVPEEYWKTEDEDVQASILKGLIVQK